MLYGRADRGLLRCVDWLGDRVRDMADISAGSARTRPYADRYVDIAPRNLPAEIAYLAPTQEWRIVWDSALDRRELGGAIASRFDGAVTTTAIPRMAGTAGRPGPSSGPPRCWTGGRCTRSSGWSC